MSSASLDHHSGLPRAAADLALPVRVLLAAAAGLLLSEGYSLHPWWWAPFLAPVPLILALANSHRGASQAGAIAGAATLTCVFTYYLEMSTWLGMPIIAALRILSWVFIARLTQFAAQRLKLGIAMLVLPAAAAALELLTLTVSHDGAAGSLAYSQGDNLGDVIAEDEDIFGDGVNVAARLEGLAAPGGICVSGTVRDHIGDRLPYSLADKGEQSVKNIARPVRVYALDREVVVDLPGSAAPIVARRRRWWQSNTATALVAAAALVLAVIGWRIWPVTILGPPSMTTAPAIPPLSKPLIAPRLSIVVLPFINLSNDPTQQYFADGITEDLTTDLSRAADMLVISRDSAFTYKDKTVNAKQIGHELGVRYVLEGSVQRSSNRVRVNAQLIDAETDTHLWAERFDREITDLFELQSEITGRIAVTLNLELIAAEAHRPVEHPDALDYIFRGREFFFGRPPTRENLQSAISLYEQALRLDPQSTEAKVYLAGALVNRVNYGFTPSPAIDLARAEKLIDEVLTAGTKLAWAHYVKGTVLRNQMRCDDAIPEFEEALALNPNNIGALQGLGWCKFYTGSLDEVIPLAEKAIRIGPRDPTIGFRYLIIGDVYGFEGRPDEAIVWYEKARGTIAAIPGLWTRLASANALRGDLADAAADLAEARRLSPDDRYSSIARMRARGECSTRDAPKVHELCEAIYFAGLRKAGMPEK